MERTLRIWDRHDPQRPRDAVVVDRRSKWGNPFRIGVDGTREEVVQKYAEYLCLARPDLYEAARLELRGRDFVCCGLRPCHAEILMLVANR